jgi:hypothetical protein
LYVLFIFYIPLKYKQVVLKKKLKITGKKK